MMLNSNLVIFQYFGEIERLLHFNFSINKEVPSHLAIARENEMFGGISIFLSIKKQVLNWPSTPTWDYVGAIWLSELKHCDGYYIHTRKLRLPSIPRYLVYMYLYRKFSVIWETFYELQFLWVEALRVAHVFW